ncbi:MAG: tetratricopeptide repeat protein [Bacteroidota bacterium]
MNTTYSPDLHRAHLLYRSSRYAEAERLIRQHMSQYPDDPVAITLLSDCLLRLDRPNEAEELLKNALATQGHDEGVLSQAAVVVLHLGKYPEALSFIEDALRITPGNADFRAIRAQILLFQKEYRAALAEANEALKVQPDHKAALNIRASAQMNLRDKISAYEALEAALRHDPGDSYTHANMGWAKLQGNDPKTAQEHFREALRLDPVNEHARAGMVEAMKAKNPIYRLILNFFFWLGSFKEGNQWLIILGAYLGYHALRSLSRSYPVFAPVIQPLLTLYIIFVLLTWAVEPLGNGVLLLDRNGRYALTDRQKLGARLVWPAAIIGFLGLIAYLITRQDIPVAIAYFGFSMLIPLSSVARWEKPAQRRKFGYIAIAFVVLGLLGLIPVFATNTLGTNGFGTIYIIGLIGFQFYANAQTMRD